MTYLKEEERKLSHLPSTFKMRKHESVGALGLQKNDQMVRLVKDRLLKQTKSRESTLSDLHFSAITLEKEVDEDDIPSSMPSLAHSRSSKVNLKGSKHFRSVSTINPVSSGPTQATSTRK